MAPRPLIAHVVHRFDYGGLENGVVNLVNRLPEADFDHAIIALTEVSSFGKRVRRSDIQMHSLHKRPGQDLGAYWRLYRLLRRLRPTVVHTRNVGTMDVTLVAWLAGVPVRVHGEHGWDIHDPDGTRRKYIFIRRALDPLVTRFVTVSQDLERWLRDRCHVAAGKITRICNGVDTERFAPAGDAQRLPAESGIPPNAIVVGTVIRFQEIKDPLNVVRAFIAARREIGQGGSSAQRGSPGQGGPDLRLAMIGDGALLEAARRELQEAGCAAYAWLPGARDDVPDLLRGFDFYVLGSRREGISNTVLEAMACGLPVLATDTGGNRELVVRGVTGELVPPEDSTSLARQMVRYATDASLRRAAGAAARERAQNDYSLRSMVERYASLYRELCGTAGATP